MNSEYASILSDVPTYVDTDSVKLFPVDPKIYETTVSDFLEIVEDAKTHCIVVHYIGGKLYYSYNI